MKTFTYVFVLLLLGITFSCKKNDDPGPALFNTIEPRSYYPIYPGSFWKYKVNDTTEELLTSDSDYKPHSYVVSMDGNTPTYSTIVYVPFLNSVPVYGYDKIISNVPMYTYFFREPFLSEKVGEQFQGSSHDPRHNPSGYDVITVVEKKKVGVDSVIITKRQTGSGHADPSETIYYTEYTKNIGITKYCVLKGSTLDTTYKKVLIDYFIND